MARRRALRWIAGAAVVACFALGYGHACDAINPCGNQQASYTLSPDGRFKSVVFIRDCGATTGFASHVSVLESEEELANQGGNVVALRLPRAAARRQVQVEWIGTSKLRVAYPAKSEVFHPKSKVGDISITYVKSQEP